ncbi:MAG: ATP-binding cassette domain-containing protein [Mariprofundaceae bacterium]|nr:ATP-binding cassette domain-containing protein [Mariprofundaceae bacterium]
MTTPVLSVQHVSVGSPQAPILDDISFHVDAGHFMGIVGPNGAGKSSLLATIVCMMPRFHGHVDILGSCLRRFNRRKVLKKVSFLTQMHHQQTHMPMLVHDLVALGLDDSYRPLWHRVKVEKKIDWALDKVGMLAHRHKDYRDLSGGQKQRTRLARMLVRQPKLLLLDEPAAGLDSQAKQGMYTLLRQLCDDEQLSIVMVEHDVAAISQHVDSVACLNKKIHYHAPATEEIPAHIWQDMYGSQMQVMSHDAHCMGCESEEES